MLEYSDLRYRKELIPDASVERVPIYFLRDAMNNFIQVDWVSEEMVNEIITSQIESYTVEENNDIAVMEYMGRVTPAFGMLGTVVGLILLLADRRLRESELENLFDRLEHEYAPRRKRYRSYLKGLQPAASRTLENDAYIDDGEDETVDTAPRPLPLNPTLHRFFLELFRR